MLQTVLGERGTGEPDDETIRNVEGWILGRESPPRHVETPRLAYSATTDPELADWLRWASESGEAPNFIRKIAEAAFLADLSNYALLRPVLQKLKRRNA